MAKKNDPQAPKTCGFFAKMNDALQILNMRLANLRMSPETKLVVSEMLSQAYIAGQKNKSKKPEIKFTRKLKIHADLDSDNSGIEIEVSPYDSQL